MTASKYEEYWNICGATQHSEFEAYLKEIVFKPGERKKFYDAMLEINPLLYIDTFKPYFEIYAAERKTNMQDYTPDAVARFLAVITRSDPQSFQTSKYAGYDPTAGTGSLIIQKWHDDRIQESPWSYVPHRYIYRADEIADNVIPYLIHNLAIRGMNVVVVHGNVLEGKVKQIYFLQNSKDDFMAYSDVNVLPHSTDCTKEFSVNEWLESEIKYTESREVVWQHALPMKRKKLEVNQNPKMLARPTRKNQLKLKDVAEIERAKKGKVYPVGTIVIQLSATKGQTGLLTSSGEIGSQYAAVQLYDFINPTFAFYQLKQTIPRHFKRVQEGLNVPLEEIGNCPISFPL